MAFRHLVCAFLLIPATLVAAVPLAVQEPPSFSLPRLDGSIFSLKEEVADRQLVLLDFWATWCTPCVKSLPEIERIAADYAERGLTVYTVNADKPEHHEKIRPFLKRHEIELPVLLDSTFPLLRALQFNGVPATVIFSAEGVLHKEMGYGAASDQMTRRRLDALLEQHGPRSSATD